MGLPPGVARAAEGARQRAAAEEEARAAARRDTPVDVRVRRYVRDEFGIPRWDGTTVDLDDVVRAVEVLAARLAVAEERIATLTAAEERRAKRGR